MKKLITTFLICVPLLSLAGQELVVAQKGKAFTQSSLSIKVGDKVSFRNDDPFAHNIFSLSEPMQFDLGTYSQGQSKAVVFSKPGLYEIECAIHPEMKMTITVKM